MLSDDNVINSKPCKECLKQIRESKTHEVATSAAMMEREERRACAAKPKRAVRRAAAAKPRWPLYRKILVAASLLAFVSATGIWLFRNSDNRSAPSFDIPMGETYKSCSPEDITISDTSLRLRDYSELYK